MPRTASCLESLVVEDELLESQGLLHLVTSPWTSHPHVERVEQLPAGHDALEARVARVRLGARGAQLGEARSPPAMARRQPVEELGRWDWDCDWDSESTRAELQQAFRACLYRSRGSDRAYVSASFGAAATGQPSWLAVPSQSQTTSPSQTATTTCVVNLFYFCLRIMNEKD